MAASSAQRQKLPSVDPVIEAAAEQVIHNAEAYFKRQRALRQREAKVFIKHELSRRQRGILPPLTKILLEIVRRL